MNQLPPVAYLVFLFLIIGGILLLASHWVEGAQLAQGFIVSLVLILILSFSGRIGTELSLAFGQLQNGINNQGALPKF